MSAGLCVLAHNKAKGKKADFEEGNVLGLCRRKEPLQHIITYCAAWSSGS